MFYNSLKTGQNFFLQHLKNKIILNYVKFVATKKGLATNFFHPSLLLLFLATLIVSFPVKTSNNTALNPRTLEYQTSTLPLTPLDLLQ